MDHAEKKNLLRSYFPVNLHCDSKFYADTESRLILKSKNKKRGNNSPSEN
jgi:hypothetical protein